MKRVNVAQSVEGMQGNINDQYNQQKKATQMEGLMKGLSEAMSTQAKISQAKGVQDSLLDQSIAARKAAQGESNALLKYGYQSQANRLEATALGTNLNNFDKALEAFGKPMDPLSMAMDLEKAKIYSSANQNNPTNQLLALILGQQLPKGGAPETSPIDMFKNTGEMIKGAAGSLGNAFGRSVGGLSAAAGSLSGGNDDPLEQYLDGGLDVEALYDQLVPGATSGRQSNPYLN